MNLPISDSLDGSRLHSAQTNYRPLPSNRFSSSGDIRPNDQLLELRAGQLRGVWGGSSDSTLFTVIILVRSMRSGAIKP